MIIDDLRIVSAALDDGQLYHLMRLVEWAFPQLKCVLLTRSSNTSRGGIQKSIRRGLCGTVKYHPLSALEGGNSTV